MNDSPPPATKPQPDKKRFQFSMRAMFIVVTIFALLLGLLTAYGRRAWREKQSKLCSSNLQQIVLALRVYHLTQGCFPPAVTYGPDGKPWHSWRVLIATCLPTGAKFDSYRFDEPWDGPNNRKLHNRRLHMFHCPADGSDRTMTSYVAVVGKGTIWPGQQSTKMDDVTDESHNTILVVEVANSGIHWMEPRDLDLETMQLDINSKSGPAVSSMHVKGAFVCSPDGDIHFLSNDHDPEMLRKLLTINDAEPASWEDDVTELAFGN